MSPTVEEIPDNLTAVSWMDGCHGQLKLTTTETVMKTEKKLKIVTCKHSAARTAVEQAADVGPMFKMVKSAVKKMPTANYENSPLFFRLTKIINDLEKSSNPEDRDIVCLPTHKKNALIVGLSKLPVAMTSSFTSPIIQSAFRDNGQLDPENGAIPNVKALLGTYRGSITKDHCLTKSDNLIKKYYHETITTGRIDENSFDIDKVVNDTDSRGNTISRDFDIGKENCQRAKILSSAVQREAREKLKESIEMKKKEKSLDLSNDEMKRHSLNIECEKRMIDTYLYLNRQKDNPETYDVRPSFTCTISKLTVEVFGCHKYKGVSNIKPTVDHIKAFIQVRQVIQKYKAGHPYYESLHGIKREDLVDIAITKIKLSVQPRLYKTDTQTKDDSVTIVT